MVGDRFHEVRDAATAIFEQQWQVYRKMVDNNYLCHREVYGLLHDVLIRDASQPFRFLDVACGDAGETIKALRGTRVADYAGIDLSGPALALARTATAELGCAIELIRRDFAEALGDWREPVDVAWIGQSVHHFRASGKLMVMRDIRRLLGDRGLLLIYEPTSCDDEGRDARSLGARLCTKMDGLRARRKGGNDGACAGSRLPRGALALARARTRGRVLGCARTVHRSPGSLSNVLLSGLAPSRMGQAYHLRVQMECAGRTESGEATGTSMGGLRLAPLAVN